MSTEIQWTDETWNPATGCTKVSPGCAHCYIERTMPFRKGHNPFVNGKTRLELHPERLAKPLTWKTPRRVFVNSLSDLFHEDVPDQFIVDVFGIMALAHRHTFQVLTKRPERMRSFLAAGDHGILRQFMLLQQNGGTSTRDVFRALDIKRRDNVEWVWPLPNVWLGVSVENQHFAEERIPLLLQTPAAVRFISAEPLLSPVDLRNLDTAPELMLDSLSGLEVMGEAPAQGPHLDWVIVGGESGSGARPFYEHWARYIVKQCREAGVPCFVKQFGSNAQRYLAEHDTVEFLNLRDRKGGDMAEWPEEFRVREFPTMEAVR